VYGFQQYSHGHPSPEKTGQPGKKPSLAGPSNPTLPIVSIPTRQIEGFSRLEGALGGKVEVMISFDQRKNIFSLHAYLLRHLADD
jgi:hypothetical protein